MQNSTNYADFTVLKMFCFLSCKTVYKSKSFWKIYQVFSDCSLCWRN